MRRRPSSRASFSRVHRQTLEGLDDLLRVRVLQAPG